MSRLAEILPRRIDLRIPLPRARSHGDRHRDGRLDDRGHSARRTSPASRSSSRSSASSPPASSSRSTTASSSSTRRASTASRSSSSSASRSSASGSPGRSRGSRSAAGSSSSRRSSRGSRSRFSSRGSSRTTTARSCSTRTIAAIARGHRRARSSSSSCSRTSASRSRTCRFSPRRSSSAASRGAGGRVLILGGSLAIGGSWFLLKDYQKDRIRTFLDPNLAARGAGYQVRQARIAIGSGGILGKGWKQRHAEPARLPPRAAHGLHLRGARRGVGVRGRRGLPRALRLPHRAGARARARRARPRGVDARPPPDRQHCVSASRALRS